MSELAKSLAYWVGAHLFISVGVPVLLFLGRAMHLGRNAAFFLGLQSTTKEVTMEKQFEIGHELQVNVSLKDLVAQVKASYKGQDGVEVSLEAKVPAHIYLQKLKAAIPGSIDDVIIDLAEQAAKLVP